MAGNTFGTLFRLTTFGESHGSFIGGVIDGCPAGLKIDAAFIENEMRRRRPGQSHITTQRNEEDVVEFVSGIFEGLTTGTPIGFLIKNKDAKSKDYDHQKDSFRPSHGDYTYQEKYGLRDYRGGGRSSARETACRVAAGAIAKLFLQQKGISIHAFVKQVGTINLDKNFSELDLSKTDTNIIRCPDEKIAAEMIAFIEEIRKEGDTVGGIVQCVIQNAPVGLGEPVFDKLNAVLAHAMLSINAVKGFELGSGFSGSNARGSEQNDLFESDSQHKKVNTITNHSGGIQGGISNGMPIYFNVAFKPVATIMQDQKTITNSGEETVLKGKGRHDPCVVPRAVPIVESMAALVMADFLLRSAGDKI
jgi:chorismate synthase